MQLISPFYFYELQSTSYAPMRSSILRWDFTATIRSIIPNFHYLSFFLWSVNHAGIAYDCQCLTWMSNASKDDWQIREKQWAKWLKTAGCDEMIVEVISHHLASTHQQSFHKFILLKVYCITDDKTKTLSERIEHLTEYLVVVWLCHVTSSVLTVFLETPVSHCSIHSFLFFPFTQFGFSTRSKPYTFSVDVRVDLTGLQSDLKKKQAVFLETQTYRNFRSKQTNKWMKCIVTSFLLALKTAV